MFELLIVPFLAGFLITAVLALAGNGLLLRGSTWQALALSQWAAVGGVLASVLVWPAWPVSLALGAAVLGLLKRGSDRERMPLGVFLVGLAAVTLLATNHPRASLAAARWAEGQLYFAASGDLVAIAGVAVAALAMRAVLKRVWLHAQTHPDVPANQAPGTFQHGCELGWLVATIVLGTLTLGVPAALATLLFPAWTAAGFASDLKGLLYWTQVLALSGFVGAWLLALALDQPFAPVLVLVNLLVAVCVRWVGALHGARFHNPN
ncbi:MAG: ABC transporter [Candidatus Competibacteraceae bacterium]|nr:ABC transporter [Candidatus Competibacteraceae bacterium]